jgi:hypothetical protein
MTTTQNAAYPLETFGPYGAIPQGTGGYQFSAGNLTEPIIFAQPAPSALTGATVTVTVDNLANGLITVDSGGTDAGTYTFPTGALIDAAFPSLKVNSGFDVHIINLGDNAANDVTFGAGTGNSIVGQAIVVDAAAAAPTNPASATFRFRKTGTAAYSIYRIA